MIVLINRVRLMQWTIRKRSNITFGHYKGWDWSVFGKTDTVIHNGKGQDYDIVYTNRIGQKMIGTFYAIESNINIADLVEKKIDQRIEGAR